MRWWFCTSGYGDRLGDSIPCRWGRAENNTVHFRGQLVAPQEYNLIVRIYVHGHIAKGECWLIASWSFAPELSLLLIDYCNIGELYWGLQNYFY